MGYYKNDDGFRSTRVVIQRKRYNIAPVSESDIKQFLGAITKFQFDYGICIYWLKLIPANRKFISC